MALIGRPASAEDEAALAALFSADAHDCHCQYWHFRGDKNAWIEACALRPAENRAALANELACSPNESIGLVAYEGDQLVGWLRLSDRAALPKVLAQPGYRDLKPDPRIALVACMLVAESARGLGVARCLLESAIALGRVRGAHALEGYPHDAGYRLSQHEAWRGPKELFTSLGFTVLDRKGVLPVFGAYPVMRLTL